MFSGGKINDPFLENHMSLPFLPAISLSWLQTLKGIFELMRSPSKALKLASVLELHG